MRPMAPHASASVPIVEAVVTANIVAAPKNYMLLKIALCAARPRVRQAPGIPHALRGGSFGHDSGVMRRENAKVCLASLRANGSAQRAAR
jgi:hypothetical protein